MSEALAPALAACLAADEAAVLVTVAGAWGSTPRETGAAMLVTPAFTRGTIGGGRLELDAIVAARDLLACGAAESRLDVSLGPAIGQCCGGRVVLSLRRADAPMLERLHAEERSRRDGDPPVLVFGAGHVGQAVARALSPLPFRTRLIDSRPGAFDGFSFPEVSLVATSQVLREVERAEAGAAFLVMTHSHAQDSLIVAAILERDDAAYVGLIGSRTKRAAFVRALCATGIAPERIDRLRCPIGGPVRDKRPAVIAALVAAELVTVLAAGTAASTQWAGVNGVPSAAGAADRAPPRESRTKARIVAR